LKKLGKKLQKSKRQGSLVGKRSTGRSQAYFWLNHTCEAAIRGQC
jgi:hypothetical protein